MRRAGKKQIRNRAALMVLTAGALSACVVDKSDIEFVPKSYFVDDTGGSAGVTNKGGSDTEAGEGSGGSSTGGSKQTGGSKTGGNGGMTSAGMGGGGTGNGGMGGMMPTDCTPGVADPLRPGIDDLEDADPAILPNAGRRGGWYTYNDGTSTQMPMAGPNMPPMHEMGGAMGTSFSMHTRGGPFTIWGAGLGIVLNGVPDKPPCAYDVTPHDGLRFWARGMNTNMRLRVSFATVSSHAVAQGGTCQEMDPNMTLCGDHFGYDFALSTSWQQVVVRWDQLTQNGWGKVVPLDLERVINIEFTVVRDVTFDFWIDEVTFY
jgi:hypothetical protein